jgi:Cytochrome P450
MTRDEEKYPEPDTFKPERFIDEHGNLNDDDMMLVFGFGRRSVLKFPLICFCLILNTDISIAFVPVDIWLLQL